MRIQGACLKEQGVTFGILVVKPHVLQSPSERSSMQSLGVQLFGMIPIILMAQNSRGIPTYWGRSDIVRFLSRVPLFRIPWKEYTVHA